MSKNLPPANEESGLTVMGNMIVKQVEIGAKSNSKFSDMLPQKVTVSNSVE